MTYLSNNKYKLLLLFFSIIGLKAFEPVFGQPDSLVLSLTGCFRGRVEGCGHCLVGPRGGLERRATLMKQHFKNYPVIGLDCGQILDLDPLGGELRSRCTILGLARFGHRAVGVSARDMFYGLKMLVRWADEAGLKLISANIVTSDLNQPLFAVWDTFKVKNKILAVSALSEVRIGIRIDQPGGWKVLTPDSALKNIIASKPDTADIYILLTDIGEADLRRMLKDVKCFNLVVSCSRQIFTAAPFTIGNAVVFHPEPDCRALDAMLLPFADLNPLKARIISEMIKVETPADTATTRWLGDCLGRPPLR
ncbi:MAG: hypothetical protein FJY65_10865 [Calditrichaeota bacterium]|nr:hypothetical protein [Calditrichota bacterium]